MSRHRKRFQDLVEDAVRIKQEIGKTVDANSFAMGVKKQAHEFYKKRGGKEGHDWEDWFEAEKVMKARTSTVEKDCIRSESFYESSHRPLSLPSEIDAARFNKYFQGNSS